MARRLIDLSGRDWLYLCVAMKELLRARIELGARPAGEILRDLQAEAMGKIAELADPDTTRLAWALNAAAARAPWRSDCLVRAMAGHRWLQREGLKPTFFLGVAKSESGNLEAHAWLKCGDVIITGGRGDEFTQLIAGSHPLSE